MNLAVGDVTLMAESRNPGILPKLLAETFHFSQMGLE